MAEEVLTIGAVLGDRYKKYMGEEPPEWFQTAEDALRRSYYWAKDCAERHEQLHKLLSFVFLLSSTSRKIFLGLLALVWAVFSFLLGSVWMAFSFIVVSLWEGISYVVMSLWAMLPFLLVSGLIGYGGFVIWGKYQTRLKVFVTTLKTNPNPNGPLIRIDVTHGSSCYEIIVPAFSTFGDVKKRFAKRTGLEVGNRRVLFRWTDMKDEVHLHQAGVVDESSVLIM